MKLNIALEACANLKARCSFNDFRQIVGGFFGNRIRWFIVHFAHPSLSFFFLIGKFSLSLKRILILFVFFEVVCDFSMDWFE